MDIFVRLLGIGGAQIGLENFNLFIDAFNDYIEPPEINSKDIVLFTHNDGDHFNPQKTLNSCTNNCQIFGPPSIAYPLLANTGLSPERLRIVYPPKLNSPIEIEIGELKVKVYQTKHFIGWEPDHISFLFKYKGKRIYFTGDSHVFDFEDPELYQLDALIYSLVMEDVVTGKMKSQDGAKLHISELNQIQKRLHPKLIIGNHLIDCHWTVATADMKKELERFEIGNIVIPEGNSKEIAV